MSEEIKTNTQEQNAQTSADPVKAPEFSLDDIIDLNVIEGVTEDQEIKEASGSSTDSSDTDNAVVQEEDDEVTEEKNETAEETEVSETVTDIPEEPAVPADLGEEERTTANSPATAPRARTRNADLSTRVIREIGVTEDSSSNDGYQETEEMKESLNWANLLRKFRRNEILRANVQGVIYNRDLARSYIVTSYYGIKINIPDNEFFDETSRFPEVYYREELISYRNVDEPKELEKRLAQEKAEYVKAHDEEPSDNWVRRRRSTITNRLIAERQGRIRWRTALYCVGASIPFLITSAKREKVTDEYDNSNYTVDYIPNVVASRRRAMAIIRHVLFEGRRPVAEGDIRKAFILRATTRNAVVECCGTESHVSAFDLDVDNPADSFKPGDEIKVVIRKIFPPEKEGGTYGLSLSHAAAKLGLSRKRILELTEGEFIRGKVRTVSRRKGYYTVKLDNDIIAYVDRVANSLALYPGETVLVAIRKIDRKNCYVTGSATKLK